MVSALNFAGLAVFQVIKAGFVFSGKAGSGVVIARLPDGSWSAPSCIATGGLGWGLQIGADITDFVIVLNSEDAVRAFSLGGNMTIGGNISASAGPIGTGGSVAASLAHPAPMFSYSKSKGMCTLRLLVFSIILSIFRPNLPQLESRILSPERMAVLSHRMGEVNEVPDLPK
jgi:hypothetical protein